jgi:hypothetical protein
MSDVSSDLVRVVLVRVVAMPLTSALKSVTAFSCSYRKALRTIENNPIASAVIPNRSFD